VLQGLSLAWLSLLAADQAFGATYYVDCAALFSSEQR
jgi:hypothetical protein